MYIKREFVSFEYSLDSLTFKRQDGTSILLKRGDKVRVSYVDANIKLQNAILILSRFDYELMPATTTNKKMLKLYFTDALDISVHVDIAFQNIYVLNIVEEAAVEILDEDTNKYITPATGDLDELETVNKNNLVKAVNEINKNLKDIDGTKYTADLSQNKAIYNVGTASNGTNLTSSIIEGQVMPAVKGNTIRNGVKNGNFYLGGSYWSVAYGTGVFANNIATLTGNGTNPYIYFKSDANTHAYIVGHKYFIGYNFKSRNKQCTMFDTILADDPVTVSVQYRVMTPNTGELIKVATILTPVSNGNSGASLLIYSSFADNATENGAIVEISNVMVVDLTQLYGAGSEPTVAQFEALLNGYVDSLSGIASLVVKSTGLNICGVLETGNYNNETGLPVVNALYARSRDYIPVKNGVSYCISGEINTDVRFFYYTSSRTFISTEVVTFSTTHVFTVPSTARYVKFHTLLTKLTNGILSKVQIEEGSTASSYAEYEESTMEVPTLYKLPNGVYDEILDDGTYVKRIGEYTLLATDITSITKNTYCEYLTVPLSRLTGIIIPASNDAIGTNILTSKTRPLNGGTLDSASSFWVHMKTINDVFINAPLNTYATLALAQADLTGTKIIYELATPVITLNAVTPLTVYPKGTISLSSSIIPETIISYPVDVAGVIKNLNQAVTALAEGANVIDSFASNDPKKALSARKGKELYDVSGYIENELLATGVMLERIGKHRLLQISNATANSAGVIAQLQPKDSPRNGVWAFGAYSGTTAGHLLILTNGAVVITTLAQGAIYNAPNVTGQIAWIVA